MSAHPGPDGDDDQQQAWFDIALVGSGLAGTYGLIRIVEGLLDSPPVAALRLVSIDREGEFHAGVPYGRRSGTNAFTITALKSFMPLPERERLTAWLTSNRDWMFEEFRANGGELSSAWLDRHRGEIEAGQWDELYLPRYLVGRYLHDRVREVLAQAEVAGLAHHTYVSGEATDVEVTNGGYKIHGTFGQSVLRSRKVVLAVGMPAAQRFAFDARSGDNEVCLIDDPYDPGVSMAMSRIEECIATGQGSADVLILGGNASALEMIFRLRDNDRIRPRLGRIWVASPSGVLPRRLLPPDPTVAFEPTHMLGLLEADCPTARAVHDAMRDDIEEGARRGVPIADTLAPIFGQLGAMLGRLDRGEKEAFATTWGLKLVRFQRRAGTEFSDMIESLTAQGHLRVLPMAFVAVGCRSEEGITFRYRTDDDASIREHPVKVRVIVNCTGSAALDRGGSIGLIDALATRGLVRMNGSGRGVVVDDRLQANADLFVLGPLMSGNVIGNAPVWHMEDCGRIISYADLLAESVGAVAVR